MATLKGKGVAALLTDAKPMNEEDFLYNRIRVNSDKLRTVEMLARENKSFPDSLTLPIGNNLIAKINEDLKKPNALYAPKV